MRIRLLLLCLLSLGFALANFARASLVAHDDFDSYTAGAALNGLAGGAGWSSAGWDAKTGAAITSSEPITYLLDDGTVLGGGKALKATAAADYLFLRRLATPVTGGGDVFVSFIFRIGSNTAGDQDSMETSGNVFTAWQAIDIAMNGAVDTIGLTGSGGKAGARVNNLTASVSPVLRFDQTYLFVIKYVWSSSASAYRTCQVWVNPTVADEATLSPAITAKYTATTGGSSSFDGLRVRTLGLSATGRYYLVDTLRVGTTWADVVGDPSRSDRDTSPRLVVFGDSLSSGGEDGTPLTSPTPTTTNGGYPRLTWAQQVSELAGYGVLVNGYPQRAGGTNYAKSGDQTDTAGLTTQVNTYLADVANVSSPKNIFVLWLGTNDVSTAVNAYKSQILSNPSGFINSVTNALPAAADRMETQIRRLIASGARRILWVDLPNMGATPLVDYYVDLHAGGNPDARPTLASAMERASRSFNNRLTARVAALRTEFPAVAFHTFSAWDRYAEVFANPAAFGFTNVTEGSLESNDHFFRDRIHPTSHAHTVIASSALATFSANNLLATPLLQGVTFGRSPLAVGDTITIAGESFHGLQRVLIGETEAPIIAANGALIKVRFPSGASSGAAITVITATGQTTATLPWIGTPASVIVSLSPLAVHPGDSVTITGEHLAGASVTIGGAVSTITASSETLLTVTVPAGVLGSTVAVAVTTDGGRTTASQTLSITPDPENFTVVQTSPDWRPYTHSLDIAAGGVFDQSALNDAPAGKHGALRATPDGHFEFENRPGERVRFWGVNLVQMANYLNTNAQVDALATRLARSGYNTVRIHLFDEYLVSSSLAAGKNSWDLDATRLLKLDYLFHALKRQGIYINIDLFATRGFSDTEAESFGPGITPSIAKNYFKGLIPVSDAALESWKKFATNLLSHRNPYTGLTWAADPALIGICPVNENQPHHGSVSSAIPTEVSSLYKNRFTAQTGSTTYRGPAWNRFVFENSYASNDAMAAHIRSLGTKALITTANTTKASALTLLRSRYDYVDDHLYWDHPSFPDSAWSLPINFSQASATQASASSPGKLMPSRIFGKPFTNTEFRFCRPNRYRAEGALLVPAYAGLQDWDGLYNFDYAKDVASATTGTEENYFTLTSDPISLVGDRLGALLFRRGDIAPASTAIAYAVTETEAYANDPSANPGREIDDNFRQVGLIARIGSFPGTPAATLAARPELAAAVVGSAAGIAQNTAAKTYLSGTSLVANLRSNGILPPVASAGKTTSETGEIELDATAGALRIVTPRGEHFLLPSGATLSGNRISVANGSVFGALSVVALKTDADATTPTLAKAHRLLVTHLTDALTTGMTFAETDRRQLTDWGALPHLVRRGTATLTLRLPPGEWQAWSVDATGARTAAFPLTRTAPGSDQWTLAATTVDSSGATRLAYELARAPLSGFAAWQAARFTSGQLADSAISGPAADPDGDSRTNLLEYAAGSAPLSSDAGSPLQVFNADTASGPRLALRFDREKTAAAGVALTPQVTSDLTAEWHEGPDHVALVSTEDLGATERLTWHALAPLASQTRLFLRLLLTPLP